MMKDILRATKAVPDFHDKTQLLLMEASPTLQLIQKHTLAKLHTHISWQNNLDNLPALPLFLVANEFLDALPVEQYVGDNLRTVDVKNDAFVFAPQGNVTHESSPTSLKVIERIGAQLRKFGGAALIIDYGYAGGSHGDTLQAVHAHKYSDPLNNPGDSDITAHVDFASLLAIAKSTGVQSWGVVEQGMFLRRLGAELRATQLCKQASARQQQTILSGLERLIAPHQMGSLFKVMALTSALDKPAGF